MNEDILKLVSKTDVATHLLSKSGSFVVNDILGVSLLFAGIFAKKPGKYLIICSNLYNAQKVTNLISSLIGNENVLLYPSDDVLRCELLTASKELLAQRLYVLNELCKSENKIVVTHASSVITPLPTKNEFIKNTLYVKTGDKINLKEFKEQLVKSGYSCVNKIDQSMQFASRGDILDIFSVNYLKPIRIELFDNEVENINFFDIGTQTSSVKIKEASIIPATDLLMSFNDINNFNKKFNIQLEKDLEFLNGQARENLQRIAEIDKEKITQQAYNPRTYKYYQFIKEEVGSLFEYFEPDISYIANKPQFDSTIEYIYKESRQYFADLCKNGELLSHLELYQPLEKVFKGKKMIYGKPFKETSEDFALDIYPILFDRKNLSDIKKLIKSYLDLEEKVVICVANKQQFETIENILKEEKFDYQKTGNLSIPKKAISLSIFNLEEGFEFAGEKVVVLTAKELFGYTAKSNNSLNRFRESIILKNYEDLNPGDYVVHEYYGIGQFKDIETIETDGIHRDYLKIIYAGETSLLIPLNQFRLVRKYSGREGAAPKLSNINSNSWEKTKTKIKERVNLLADRLYQLYSERAQVKGFAFQLDDDIQKQFENEFPYELTADQKESLEEIKRDMESDVAMDRLLCGDVGFGKTEVAFRAIFKAISSGKQAALLCPTTLLARQHYERALERFQNYGVKIAIVSRLVSGKTQRQYMKEIKEGKIHLVIGTHRLLSKDFSFKDLGLLVVDEEQRFGVEQKEQIKELKNNIDVLSLSATPIPRTLQLSLMGVRPVSQINTAPVSRSTIQTYVAPYKDEVVKELIERELNRDGQVFYVHNTVSTIAQSAANISKKVPYANVAYVHGQMSKDEIEDVMMRFYAGEINVLVATSIIENGIDIPNANLIIVEDADHFGLSQLYQIKGRVGRGDRIAYAYLLFRDGKNMSAVASKRLKAIQDFAELGSGYKIAQRDLMIRGAGDVLGPEQAGFIDSIGLDLYLKMLNEVIEERNTGKPVVPPKPVKLLSLDAYIPGEYASKEDKIQLYQEIESADSLNDLNDIKKKVRNIYGRLPDEVSLLFRKRKVDILLVGEEFTSISEFPENIELVLSKKFSNLNGIGNQLFNAVAEFLDKIQVTYIQKILKIKIKKNSNWFMIIETLVEIIHNLYKNFDSKKVIE